MGYNIIVKELGSNHIHLIALLHFTIWKNFFLPASQDNFQDLGICDWYVDNYI